MTLPAGYEIARPRLDELSQLPSIEAAAAAIFPPQDLAPQLRDYTHPVSFFEELSSAGRLWVARRLVPETPVGFAAVVLLDGTAHLEEMDVVPDHAGRGLGRALVDRVAQWARGAGFDFLSLTTFRHLAWNAPFYARLGFAETPSEQMGVELRAALAEEAAEGLDPVKRVAMRLDLRRPAGAARRRQPKCCAR